MRDAVRDCLRAQVDGSPVERVVETRQQLNIAYDRFAARFGPLNLRANQRAFDGDPDLPLLLSLTLQRRNKAGDQGHHLHRTDDSSSQAG